MSIHINKSGRIQTSCKWDGRGKQELLTLYQKKILRGLEMIITYLIYQIKKKINIKRLPSKQKDSFQGNINNKLIPW